MTAVLGIELSNTYAHGQLAGRPDLDQPPNYAVEYLERNPDTANDIASHAVEVGGLSLQALLIFSTTEMIMSLAVLNRQEVA